MSQTQAVESERLARLKAKMAASRQELVATLEALTPEQLGLPTRNEGWTVRDVAAHIACAEGGMEVVAHRILNRETGQREAAAGFDVNRYNQGRIKKRADKTIPELVEELHTSRARMLEIIAGLNDEDLDIPGYHPTAGEISLLGLFVVIYKHEQTHTEDIRLALVAAPGEN